MKTSKEEKKLGVVLQADKEVFSTEGGNTRILEINITPPDKKADKTRPALNLSLVLDRSGSMSGEKLHYVKQAAAHVIDLLSEKDSASVITYDNQVDTVVSAGKLTDTFKLQAKSSIQGIRSGGSTFLSGGWFKGCEEVAKAQNGKTIDRTLLLTDGLANVGIQDLEELSTHSKELFKRGISTSCFGVGHGYNEHLLEAMATSGGGNFHYLETLNAIPIVFEREFEELLEIALRDVVIVLEIPEGIAATVSGGWPTQLSGNKLTITLGSILSGQPRNLYLSLVFDKSIKDKKVSIPVTVRGKAEGDYVCDTSEVLVFKSVAPSVEESTEENKPLMERFAAVDLADKANEALKKERAGERKAASNLMRDSINLHSRNMSAPQMDKFNYLSDVMEVGMDEMSRKRHHQEEYENKRGRIQHRHYDLEMVNGHLIATIENQRVLVDTGIPISLGKTPEFYLLNRVHQLSPEYMGVTLDYLRKMVGTHIDILMGSDILKKYFTTIEVQDKRITIGAYPRLAELHRIPMVDFMGTPIVKAIVGGNRQKVFVDSGAKLSYVNRATATNFSYIGTEKDFYPGMGEFETKVYEIPFSLDALQFTLRCGVLPNLLEASLQVTGNTGIIGSEFFQKHRVCLAYPEGRMLVS